MTSRYVDADASAVSLGRVDDEAAFFDLDNTMLRGASVFYFGRELRRRGLLTLGDLRRMAWLEVRFRMLGEKLEHIDTIRDTALAFVRGHRVADLRAIGEHVYDDVLGARIWPGVHELAQQHRAAGRRVWLVTAGPMELAATIAHRLGLSGAVATVAEEVDGSYTGRLVGPPLHGSAKADAVRALAAREGLDLARCAAYSDSVHDVPLLSLVGRPYAVNPDARLRAYARVQGWPVLEFRARHRLARVGVRAAVRPLAGVRPPPLLHFRAHLALDRLVQRHFCTQMRWWRAGQVASQRRR
jgi:HAD superfamily hydrolase (TIGR01490 family)